MGQLPTQLNELSLDIEFVQQKLVAQTDFEPDTFLIR